MKGVELVNVSYIKTIYGNEILEEHLKQLDDYIIITDPVPWDLYQNEFNASPLDVVMPGTLDKEALEEMILNIPKNVEFVGLGGGAVIDIAKYFAYLRGKTPVLVPTITSSNAHFSDFISVRRDGAPFGFKKIGWPKKVIVDYAFIAQADPRLNRAGYGDLLFLQTALNDWKLAEKRGKGTPVVPAIEKEIEQMMHEALMSAEEIGSVSNKGLDILMRLIERSTLLMMNNLSKPISAGAEHLFAWNFEQVTGREPIHGELVALGILITSHLHQRNFKELKDALDKGKIMYRPDEIGISWSEIKQTLLTVEEYNRKVRKMNTIFDEVTWDEKQLKEIKEVIYAL